MSVRNGARLAPEGSARGILGTLLSRTCARVDLIRVSASVRVDELVSRDLAQLVGQIRAFIAHVEVKVIPPVFAPNPHVVVVVDVLDVPQLHIHWRNDDLSLIRLH